MQSHIGNVELQNIKRILSLGDLNHQHVIISATTNQFWGIEASDKETLNSQNINCSLLNRKSTRLKGNKYWIGAS